MQADRRDATAPRRRYEALVEVGSDSVGGFEAESVDVSLDGIRLRTAYMPRPGERLMCRFDGYGGEIVAEGEVIWTEREGRGGELGLRFTGLDKRGIGLLEELCGPAEESEDDEPSAVSAAPPGAKVRLHIQGLGSPMRARVRDTARGEVLVGSNLEFLRVGRNIELEDVERQHTRAAFIEHVTVEVDPETQVPQLVVALAYGEPPSDDELTTAPIRVRQAIAPKAPAREEITPEPTVIDNGGPATAADEEEALAAPVAAPRRREKTEEEAREAAAGYEDEPEDDEPSPPAPVRAAAWAKAASVFAGRMRPHLTSAGKGAKSAVGRLAGAVKKKAELRRERAQRGPKRTTAPPPGGALRSDGKRLFRQQHPRQSDDEASVSASQPAAPPGKRRALVSAVLGALAVLAIYGVSSQLSSPKGPEASADPALATSAPLPGEALPLDASIPGENSIGSAEVPLYGPTPLSTTEPVPVPPSPSEAAEADEESPEEPEASPALDLSKEWGVGEITNPTELPFKMDGAIEGLTGKEIETGFTITVPGRKSTSNAAGLARRDKRLDSVNVVNYPDRSEITVRFKNDVPAFVAKARGKRLVIEIGAPEKKKAESKKSDKKSSSKTSKKKKK